MIPDLIPKDVLDKSIGRWKLEQLGTRRTRGAKDCIIMFELIGLELSQCHKHYALLPLLHLGILYCCDVQLVNRIRLMQGIGENAEAPLDRADPE